MAALTKAEHDLALAVKERQAAVKEAELHRNQHTGIEFEYERFRQRSEAREKELIESLQEARSGGGNTSNGSDSFKLDQKREEMKRLEMQNYEFTLQLEECNKQIEQLKTSCLEHHRKLEHVKQAVLQYQQTPAQVEDVAQSLVNSLRKLLLSHETGAETEANGSLQNGFQPTATGYDANRTNGIDGNATILGEEKTIQELVKIVEQLEDNIQILERERCSQQEASDVLLGKLKSKLESKYASIEQLEKELKQWKEKFESQTTEYDELSTQLMDQMQDNETLRKEFELYRKSQTELEQETQTKRSELDREIVTLRESLERLTTEREEIQHLCESLKAAAAERVSQVNAIVADKEKLALEFCEAKVLFEESVSQKNELSKELMILKEEKETGANIELETLRNEIVRQESEMDKQRSVKEMLLEENGQFKEELEMLRKEQEKLSAESVLKESDNMVRLQLLKDNVNQRVKQLEEELESCQRKCALGETEQQEQLKRFTEEKEILTKASNDLQLKIDEMQALVNELTAAKTNQPDMEQFAKEKECLLEEINDLRQQQVTQEARVEKLQQMFNQYEKEFATRESKKCEALEISLKQVRDELESSNEALAQLTQERDAVVRQEANSREELLIVQETIKMIETRILELEQELASSRSEQEILLEKQKEDRLESEKYRNEMEHELEMTKNMLAKSKDENSDILKQLELTKAKETLEQQLLAKDNELVKIASELEAARRQCNVTAEEQKTDRESYDTTRQKLEEEIELLKKMVDQVSADKTFIEKEHSECSTRHSSLQNQLEEREVEMLKYITDLDLLRAEQIRLVGQQNDTQRELQEKNANLQQELDSLQENILQLMSKNEALLKEQIDGAKTQQKQYDAETEELVKLRSCRDESERLVAQLERDLSTVRAELEMVRTELLEEKQRRDACEQTEKERTQSMKEEMERLRCSIIALEDEKRRLEEEQNRLQTELEAKEKQSTELEALQQEKETLLDELRKENSDLTIAVQELSAKIVNLEEQMDSNEAIQRKTIDTLVRERHEQEDTVVALKRQLTAVEEKLKDLEKQHQQVHNELREVKASLEESLTARLRLEMDIEESSGVRDVLERELQNLKSDLEKLANERYEQERQVSINLRRELDEKQKELESFMATGRPSLGDGRVAQALRRENEDLLKQLNEARQIDGLKGRQLQERVDELERLEREIARLRDEMSTMRHDSSFNEKLEEITHLQQKVQDSEKVREETVHQKRSLERAFDQLRFKHQSLAKEVDELRRTTDKERKSRRQSTHDDRRGLLFNSKEMATMTDPTSTDCACSEMNDKIKELRNKLTLKDCQLNTQKLISSANPLKNEITEMRRKLEDKNREKSLIEQELHSVLQELDREKKDRKRHCTQCMRHSRQQNARCDKAVQAYQPSESPCAAVSVSIVATGSNGLVEVSETSGSMELKTLQKRYDEQQEQYERLNEKYQTMKQLCRIRNEKITNLSIGLAEKENENTNVNRSIQNECIQLKQQLKEAENRYAQIYHSTFQTKAKSSNRSDVGLQTDKDDVREEVDMYRAKYERYKALSARLLEEAKTYKLNAQRTTNGV